MRKINTSSFRFQSFSRKQKKILTWWQERLSPYADYDGIIADGAIRSGKTISMSLSYVIWAMETFGGANLAICGKTIGSLRRNVITTLKQMMPAIGCECTDRRAENLLIITDGVRTNYFYLFGGKDESSQDLVQGITLAGAFFDEVALMPESFVNQATARCSVEGAKWWFNCNPSGPYHWFKRGWIDRADERRLLYLHFRMTDNKTLSEKTLQKYRNMYTGVFAERYINGKWAVADGVIYDMFREDTNVTESLPFVPEREFVACDYGTYNPCVFLHFCAGGSGDNINHHIDREYYHNGRGDENNIARQKTDAEYAQDMLEFTAGRKDIPIIVDPSAASFIAELRKHGYRVIKARNDVSKGISVVSVELAQKRLTISPECIHTKKELLSYVWDTKHAENTGEDKPVKENDHCCDAMRYGVYYDCLHNSSARPSISKGAR